MGVLGLRPAHLGDRGHDLRPHPDAADRVVHRVLAVRRRQGRNLGADPAAIPGDRLLPDRLGDAAPAALGTGVPCQGEVAVGDQDGRVPIADFVAGLREELKTAQAARDPDLEFTVGPVTVEFTVVTAREGGPTGKVRFWVIEAGGSAKWSASETQTVTLTLTPVGRGSEDVRVGDRVRRPAPGLPDPKSGSGQQ